MEKIEIKDIGPVKELSFQLDGHGLTVLVGANGKGKSIVLDAIQKAALGKGKLPLRDGARRGMVDCCGAIITVGQVTRHTGEFQVENLESRLPLAQLVDPQIAKPEAADRARIKALVALTGVTASRELFTSHPAFADFSENVGEDATKTDDLVEMAARVKRDYEAMARDAERAADREEGHVRGLEEAAAGVDLQAESDSDLLQAAYDAARDRHTEIATGIAQFETQKGLLAESTKRLVKLKSEYTGLAIEEAEAQHLAELAIVNEQKALIEDLTAKLKEAKDSLSAVMARMLTTGGALDRARDHAKAVKALELTIAEHSVAKPKPEGIEEALAKRDAAKAALELGVKIRDAKQKLAKASAHKEAAAKCRKESVRLRETANCVDEILSNAIHCERLRIASVDGVARLVVDHPERGEAVPYHDLSMGEKVRIAIDLSADIVGEDGLLVLEQSLFESLDVHVRQQVHAHAVERKCYVLTAEATRDPEASGDIEAIAFNKG